MPTEQLLVRLPEDLIRKFRRNVPDRKRSAFVRALLEKALEVHEGLGDPAMHMPDCADHDDHSGIETTALQHATAAGGHSHESRQK
jgi:hypothetical protein